MTRLRNEWTAMPVGSGTKKGQKAAFQMKTFAKGSFPKGAVAKGSWSRRRRRAGHSWHEVLPANGVVEGKRWVVLLVFSWIEFNQVLSARRCIVPSHALPLHAPATASRPQLLCM